MCDDVSAGVQHEVPILRLKKTGDDDFEKQVCSVICVCMFEYLC